MSVRHKQEYVGASLQEYVGASLCSMLTHSWRNVNWIAQSDEEIIDATMGELARLFPTEIARDDKWPSTSKQGPNGQAKLLNMLS